MTAVTKNSIIRHPENPLLDAIDISQPQAVQIEVTENGKTLWVNVDGVCRLRVSNILNPLPLTIKDSRPESLKRS